MSEFNPEKKVSTDFNSGVEYRNKVDSPSAEDFNNVIEYLLYLGEQNVVTIDTAQTITGEKVFTSPLDVRGVGYSYVTISNDGYIDISSEERSQYPIYLNSYGITIRDRDSGISRTKFFPEIGERDETFSTREWVNEQYDERVTKNARNIQSLLAMQAKTVMERTLTDSYTARQTADGADIVDGALTYPTKISGKTVAVDGTLKHAYFKGVRSIGRQLLNPAKIVDNYFLQQDTATAINNVTFSYYAEHLPIIQGKSYYVYFGNMYNTGVFGIFAYDKDKNFLRQYFANPGESHLIYTPKTDEVFVRFNFKKATKGEAFFMLAEGDRVYEEYKDDTSFAYTETQQLKEYDYLLPQEGKKVEQTAVITSETEFTDEQIAQYADYILSEDKKTLAYKTATATETDLKPEKASYFAYDKGQEIVDEGETKNSEYGATVTIEQDYYVWIGGEE